MPSRKVWGVMQKDYLDGRDFIKPTSSWSFKDVNSERGTEEFINLDFDKRIFAKPKPLGTIKRSLILSTANDKDSIILDFFSGSATTAHAVMQLNAEDGGNRKFIMVQLPEQCDEKSEAYKAGYMNICEIGKEHIRRAGAKIIKDQKAKSDSEGLFKDESKTSELDIGFRVLKLDSSNMQDVYYTPQETEQKDLFGRIDNKKADRTDMDLLFQTMLDLGISLSSKIECKKIDGKDVYFVEDTFLAACFDRAVNEKVVTAIAETHPVYVVLRDMDSDAMITNFEQILKVHGVNTDNARII